MKNNLFIIAIILVFVINTANASSTYWLGTNAQTDGSIQTQNVTPIATDFQATATTLEAYIYFNETNSTLFTNGLNYLIANHNNSTEHLARIIQIQSQVSTIDQSYVETLLSRINDDGGIGEGIDFSSNTMDSAWALLAFSVVENIDSSIIEGLFLYIKHFVNDDFGYSNFDSNESSIYVSSLVNLSFNKYKNTYSFLIEDILKTNQFLVSKQQSEGGWQETYETALAIIALTTSNYSPSTYWLSVLHLRNSKTGITNYNTSWNEEVYTTALALMAEGLTAHLNPPSTNNGSITGIIVDSSSNQVINGALAMRDGFNNSSYYDYSNSSGIFTINNVNNGSHTLEITYPGYISENLNFEITDGQILNIGKISLLKIPTTGLIKGVVYDGDSNLPTGAQIEITADTIYTINTDAQGRFQQEIPAGNFTIKASKNFKNAVQISSTIQAGEVIDFSPSLYENGIGLNDVELIGRVISNDTHLPINNATITVNAINHQTDTDGKFLATNLAQGLTSISISATNYQTIVIQQLLTGGTVNLGDIILFPNNSSSSSTVFGVLKIGANSYPLSEATVSIVGTNLSNTTDQDGSYQISGIPTPSYQVLFTLVGYESAIFNISSIQHTISELNTNIALIGSSPIIITEFLPERFEYKGAVEVEIDVEIRNTSTYIDSVTRLYLEVHNSSDELISAYPLKLIPFNGTTLDASEIIPRGGIASLTANWNTGFNPPDDYTVTLKAFDQESEVFYTQESAVITILPVKALDVDVKFNPDVTNFNPTEPIEIIADINSAGSEPIGNITVTANVYLDDKANNSTQATGQRVDEFTDPLLNTPRLMEKDSNGDLIIYNALNTSRKFVKFKADGSFEELFVAINGASDFSLNSLDQIHTIAGYCRVYKYDSVGNILNNYNVGLNECKNIEVIDDNNVYVSSDTGIHNLQLDTGVVTQVVGEYLRYPQGMIKHSDGRIIIADSGLNALIVYENNTLNLWVDGLNAPHGLTEDIDGSVLVANYGSDEIIRVLNDGTKVQLDNTIQSPFDIKLNPTGGYYVSSESENKLYQLDTNGNTSVIYDSYINSPEIITSGNNSDVYIYNAFDKTIIHRLADGTATTLMTAPSTVYDMTVDMNDNLIIDLVDNIYKVETDLSLTALSSTNFPRSKIKASDNTPIVYINNSPGIIDKVDTSTNTLTNHIINPFLSIVDIKAQSNDMVYILDSGNLTQVDSNMNYQRVLTGISGALDLFISSTDEIFISKSNNTVIKLDASYNIVETINLSNRPDYFVINSFGDVLYSNRTDTIYKNDGVTDSIYIQLAENIYGDIAINTSDTLLVSYSGYNITQVFDNLTVNTVDINAANTDPNSSLSRATKISIDYLTGDAWVMNTNGIFKFQSNAIISTSFSSTNIAYNGSLTQTSNNFFLATSNIFSQYDLNLNLDKNYANFSEIYDFTIQESGDIVIATASPHQGLIRYQQANKLPEYMTDGRYYKIHKSLDDNHLLATTLFKLINIDLTSYAFVELVDINTGNISTINLFTQINNNQIHLIEKSFNKYSIYDFSGNQQFKLLGLTNLQGLSVDIDGSLYLTDTSNIYKFVQNGEIDLVYSSLAGGYLDVNQGVITKTYRNGNQYNININTQQRSNVSSPISQVSSIIREGNDYFSISTYGLFKTDFDGNTEVIISSVRNIKDMLKMSTGEIFIVTDNFSIDKLSSSGLITNHRLKLDLYNERVSQLIQDNGILYAYDATTVNQNIIRVDDNTKIQRPFGISSRLNSIAVRGNYLLGINDDNNLFKAEIIDYSQDTPVIGDLVYSSIRNINADIENLNLLFDPFLAPIAGDYHVDLEFSDNEIEGKFRNSLHVGNIANGVIQLLESTSPPGDIVQNTTAFLEGLDISSFADMVEMEEELIYDYDGSFYNMSDFIVVDGDTFNFVSNRRTIQKYDRTTNTESIIYVYPGSTVDTIIEMIKDNSGDIILLPQNGNNPTVLIDTDGNILQSKNFNALFNIVTIQAGDIDSNNQLVILAKKQNQSYYSVYRIDTQADTIEEVFSNVSPEFNLWITKSNNIYLMGTSVYKIDTTNNSIELLKEGISNEGEGNRIGVAVCEDNPIFTDFAVSFGEESEIYTVNGDIIYDTKNTILYPGESYSKLADIETLYYDKYLEMMYIFNHLWYTDGTTGRGNHGDIISIPVNCGKMFVELHLTDQNNTSLNSFNIPPNQTFEIADNTNEYVWIIDELDEVQKIFNFQTQIDDLLPNESRPILSSAYLKFKNGFNPQQDLIVNLDIPSILGVVNRTLTVNLDNVEYQGNTNILIASNVDNSALAAFNGIIVQYIEDAQGLLVATIADTPINNLTASSQSNTNLTWNTLNYYAGQYTLVSKLYDDQGNLQDKKRNAFTIIASETNQNTVNLQILTDKIQYATIDRVEISPSLHNLSNNNILQNHQAQLLVADPNGVIILQTSTAVNALASQSIQSWQQMLNLNQALLGSYTISLNLLDSNAIIIANSTRNFEVVLDAQLLLTGNVLVANQQIQPPLNNSCYYELSNVSTQALTLTGIEIHQTVVNLSSQITIQDDVISTDLATNQTWSNNQTIVTNLMASGDHACVLRTIINGTETTQASDIFFVTGANIISGTVWGDTNGDGINNNGETGIEFVEIKLLDNAQQVLQTLQTNGSGMYQSAPISNGQYSLEVNQSGVLQSYIRTFGENPSVIDVQNAHQQIDFGYQSQIGTISGIIWNDENDDQQIDVDETFYQGININLLDPSDNIIISTQSGVDGVFEFLNQLTGQYKIEVTDDSGALLGLRNTTNNNPLSINLLPSTSLIDQNFGYRQDINDLAISTSNCVRGLQENQSLTYQVEITNLGNTDINQAQVTDIMPTGLDNITWNCNANGGASCTNAGTNSINDSINMPAGSSLIYTINATLNAPLGTQISNHVSITMPNGITDDFPANNTAVDSDTVLDIIFANGFDCAAPTPVPADVFDLAISTSNCTTGLKENQQISYLIQVNNFGNTDIQQAQVNSQIPIGLTNISWTCQTTGIANCSPSGIANINDIVDISSGSTINYTLNGTVSAQLLEIITSDASITMPNGTTDDIPINNTAQDSDMVLDIVFLNGFECAAATPLTTSKTQQQKILWGMLKRNKKSKLMSYIKQNTKIETVNGEHR